MEFHQKISMPNYPKLKTMVKRRKDQKLRLRNFDARHGRIETGAEIKNRKKKCGVEGGKGTCYQWKANGQCSKGDQCIFWHESNDRAQNTLPPRLPSHPSHEVEVCEEKKYPRQKEPWCHSSTSVQILFDRYLHANASRILASSRGSIFTKRKR